MKTLVRRIHPFIALFFMTCRSLLPTLGLEAQEVDWSRVRLHMEHVRGSLYMISNAGGNIAAFVGDDGVLLVDAGYAEMAEKTLAAVEELTAEGGGDPQLVYVVNTHWHYDHTGGNEALRKAGAIILAHESADRLMAEDRRLEALGRDVPATPPEGRPVITFNDRMNLRWNGDLLHLVHMPLAHTDGDVIVHFRDVDVVHVGDLFFNGTYPYIDVDYGGNLQGMVRAVHDVLDHTGEGTLFIPGHGPLGTRSDLESYGEMLATVLERMQEMMDAGMGRESVIQSRPTAEFDEKWAPEGSFLDPDYWVGLVYDGMVRAVSGS
jgi:glyoxylase-like metal-dependent hydrolase (beta-lactamase superfamily II)